MGHRSRRAESEPDRALTPRRRAALRARLLAWYRTHRRDLPWRRTRDPYAIWISEAMLQQTRVETVIPYYERFLARFPDVEAGARVAIDDRLGLSGATGLAGGDHLHFATLIGNTYVDPIEWWDAKWVTDHVAPNLSPPATN